MAQISCRVTDDLNNALEDAAAEAGLFRSDVIRQALIHYIATNPQQYTAFNGIDSPGGFRLNTRETTDSTERTRPVFDPTRDL